MLTTGGVQSTATWIFQSVIQLGSSLVHVFSLNFHAKHVFQVGRRVILIGKRGERKRVL